MRARAAESYLAALAAGGALIASALLLFTSTAGVVTFDSWPGLAGLLGGAGHVSISAGEASLRTAPPLPAASSGPVHTGHRGPAARAAARSGSGSASSRHPGQGGVEVVPPSAPNVQHAPPVTPQNPSGPSEPRSRSIVSQTVSAAGNTAEGTANIVGDQLGGSSGPGVGGVVGGTGRVVNQTLQSLAGNG